MSDIHSAALRGKNPNQLRYTTRQPGGRNQSSILHACLRALWSCAGCPLERQSRQNKTLLLLGMSGRFFTRKAVTKCLLGTMIQPVTKSLPKRLIIQRAAKLKTGTHTPLI